MPNGFVAPTRAPDNRGAVLAMVASVALFSAGDTAMKVLGSSLPTGQNLVTRAAFAVAMSYVYMRLRGESFSLAQLKHPVLWARAVLEIILVTAFVSTLPHLRLGDVTAITQTTPLMMTALAALILREEVGWRRWCAAAAGFLGVLLVARPGAAGFNVWALVAVGVAFVVALRDLITRFVPQDVSTGFVTLMTTMAAGVGGLMLAPFETWAAPSRPQLGVTVFAAAMTTIGCVFVIRAFRIGETSLVAPFRYTVIPFALLWGFLAFGERPDGIALIGIALIVGAGLYTLHRERARRAAALGITGGDRPAP